MLRVRENKVFNLTIETKNSYLNFYIATTAKTVRLVAIVHYGDLEWLLKALLA